MAQRYIVFDVETPNSLSDRMSAIGIDVVENGRIIDSMYTLVDPQTHFDPFNITLTGITPESVKGKPDFPTLWKYIEPVMGSGVLIAHNAPFDVGVLCKCLKAYNIDWKRQVDYACTVRMSKAGLPLLPSHRLNNICDCLGFSLDHHNAGSDSRACANILIYLMERGLDVREYLRTYDLALGKTLPQKKLKI